MSDKEAAKVAKALGHPLRLGLLRTFRERAEISPVQYARETGEPLGNVSYHVRVLLEAEVIAESGRVQRRGAMEHRYALSGRLADPTLAVLDLLGRS